MFSCKPVYPPVTGWLEVGLSTEALQYLYDRIAEAKGSAKGHLAGHISSSLDLEDKDNWFFNNTIQKRASWRVRCKKLKMKRKILIDF